MKLPVLQGVIRRRILLNYRADAEIVAAQLPNGMRPKLHRGFALVGVCLIRLEQIRPRLLPAMFGIASENVAHRFAVEWDEGKGAEQQGVFVARRDTNSRLNHWAGGRLFPGEHHLADFDVCDTPAEIEMAVASHDRQVAVKLRGEVADRWPSDSVFDSLDDASRFFESGSLGYSVTQDPSRLDGITLHIDSWQPRPFILSYLSSQYFDDPYRFPRGSIALDHALLMRNVPHQWHAAPDFSCQSNCQRAMPALAG